MIVLYATFPLSGKMPELNHDSLNADHFCQNEMYNQQVKQLSCFANLLFHRSKINSTNCLSL